MYRGVTWDLRFETERDLRGNCHLAHCTYIIHGESQVTSGIYIYGDTDIVRHDVHITMECVNYHITVF